MKPWVGRALLPLAIVALLVLALPWGLEVFMYEKGLPFGLKDRLGVAAQLRGFGWNHLNLSQVSWGPAGEEAFEAGAVTVGFSPAGLRAKTLDTVTLSGLTIHLTNTPDGLKLRGVAETDHPASPPANSSSDGLRLPLGFNQLDIRHGRVLVHDQENAIDIPFQLVLKPSPDRQDLLLFDAELLAGMPTPTVQGELDLTAQTAAVEYSCPLTALARFWPELAIPGVILTGKSNLTMSPGGQWTISTTAAIKGTADDETINAALPTGAVALSPIHLELQGNGHGPTGIMNLSGSIDQIVVNPANLALRTLSASLPWSWPQPLNSGAIGTLKVETITLHGKKLGSLEANILQAGLTSGTIDGAFRGAKAFPLQAEFKGRADIDQKKNYTDFDFSLNVPPLDLKTVEWRDLATLFQTNSKAFAALDLAGIITATVSSQGEGRHQQMKGEVNLNKGSLSLAEEDIEVSGVSGNLIFPDLLSGSASPRARFSFDKAAIAGLVLTNGELDLHRDGIDSLFVERVRGGWNGGTVHASGLRLTANSRDLVGDLYCDRLDLAQLLSQLGIPKVSGKGTISGRIPIKYINGKVEVAQGFLYSPPGDGGNIRLEARNLITGGVPAGSPQFGQLQFAAAALEDFSYDWLSMSLESQGEEMVIAMSLDGHPAKPLPFRYDARLGTLSQIDASGEIGINQPVRLDVNFRLPFNEFLGYGKSIQTLRDQLR